jgi:hypothetical protein
MKINMEEIWADNISHRPDLYCVSNTGKIKNKTTGLILKTRVDKCGYEDLSMGGRKQSYRGKIHRMVFKAFNPSVDIAGYDVHHIDGDKLNNHIDNLTIIKKSDHCRQHSKTRIGQLSPNFKGAVAAFNKETGKLDYIMYGRKDIEKHNFHHGAVSQVVRGKWISHRGYIFRRLKDASELKIGQIYDDIKKT